jgi:Cu2+-exporting ATPase
MKEIVLKVNGMVCEGCENRVKNVIQNIDGVESVMADYSKGKVVVISNKDVLEGTIKEIIEDIGYEIVKED